MSETHSKYIFQKQPNIGAVLEATVGLCLLGEVGSIGNSIIYYLYRRSKIHEISKRKLILIIVETRDASPLLSSCDGWMLWW